MQRDPAIDILRFIGLSLIIIAHVNAPETIIQIRMFDVPLMVFISGLSFGNKEIDKIGRFYWVRIKRLIIPVWTFIPIYFIPLAILQKTGMFYYGGGLTWSQFFLSFVFYKGGMGYIWIFKVFILVMLATPLLIKINKVIKNDYLYFAIVITMIAIQQVICFIWETNPIVASNGFMEVYGLYLLGYLPLFMLGLRVRNCPIRSENRLLFLVGIVMIIAFLVLFTKGKLPIQLSPYKYPPQVYYILYGCFMSLLLWRFRRPLVKLLDNKWIRFIGQNSDWIYLWHSLFVLYICAFVKFWVLQFVIIYALALAVCLLQKKLVSNTRSEFVRKYY